MSTENLFSLFVVVPQTSKTEWVAGYEKLSDFVVRLVSILFGYRMSFCRSDSSPSGPHTSFLLGCLGMLCRSCAGPVSTPCERGICPDSAALCAALTLLGPCAARQKGTQLM